MNNDDRDDLLEKIAEKITIIEKDVTVMKTDIAYFKGVASIVAIVSGILGSFLQNFLKGENHA